jgi:hypothetical protein
LRYLFINGQKETLIEAIRLFTPLGPDAMAGLIAANRIDFAELLVDEVIDWSEMEDKVTPWHKRSAYNGCRVAHEASRLRANTEQAVSVGIRTRL